MRGMNSHPAPARPLFFSSPLLHPHRWWVVLRRLWAALRRRAADREQLLAMDARDLRDLGLGRGEIEAWLEAPQGDRGIHAGCDRHINHATMGP